MSDTLKLPTLGPHKPWQERLSDTGERNHPAHLVQPDGDGGEDVRGDVRPGRHAAQLSDLPPTENSLHAIRQN